MSNFCKRHYEAIASAMQWLHPGPMSDMKTTSNTAHFAQWVQWDRTCMELAGMLARDSGTFDRDRFIRACIPGNNVRARS